MKAKIEIILGFLSSGKTNFINSMLKNLKDETVVIIQNEFGKTEIKYDCNNNNNTKVIAILNDTKKEEYYPIKSNFNPLLTIFIILTVLGAFSFLMFSNMLKIQLISKFCIIFTSIILKGLPFILIGSFVSSIIHFCISETIFSKIFSKNIFISCITASLAGFFFPIYDYGNILIAKELIQKKVPYGACITFMLSATIVNPLSIASTLSAFQNMKFLIVYRLFLGILISIMVGFIMHFIILKDDHILKKDLSIQYCYYGLFSNSSSSYGNIINLIKTIFIHTADEFFNMGKLMIIGVFISSAFQTIISINNIYILNDIISLIFMIALSFILSLSSNYDSFIAQSFLNCVSINSIAGFLICGPMINLKNTLMLLGIFKKRFVLKLIFFVMIISFTLIININIGS